MATTVLIAIAIASAVLVSSWLLPFLRNVTEDINRKGEIECSSASLFIREARYNCTSGNLLFFVENNGDVELRDFALSIVYGNFSSFNHDVEGSPLEPGVRATYQSGVPPSLYSAAGGFSELSLFSRTCPARGDTLQGAEIIKESC